MPGVFDQSRAWKGSRDCEEQNAKVSCVHACHPLLRLLHLAFSLHMQLHPPPFVVFPPLASPYFDAACLESLLQPHL